MRKDRNTFFQETAMSSNGFFQPGNPNMMNPNMMNPNMMNPNIMNPNMMNPNITTNTTPTYTSELESRISRIERQINRLETRVNKLEIGSPGVYMNKEDTETSINQSMYMV